MSSPIREEIPALLRPPSYAAGPMDWSAAGAKPQYIVINPMHIINLQDRTRTFGVRVVEKIKAFSERWFTHVLLLIFLMIYAAIGALLFQWVEAPLEIREKQSIIRMRELIAQNLLQYRNLSDAAWLEKAYERLYTYELQLQEHELSKAPDDSEKLVWTFWGSLFYAGTIFTTIGYGHIAPATVAGQAITIVYAFIGIPFLLMVLADLGKLFTRWIKAVFFYIKLFCRTGKFRKARKIGRRATAVPIQYMSVAWNKMPYPYQGRAKKIEEPPPEKDIESDGGKLSDNESKSSEKSPKKGEKKKTEEKEVGEKEVKDLVIQPTDEDVDDEFNLPVSLAILLLLTYMMMGAFIFTLWEPWTFFESFYFVFISMSTIGFGDYVPKHQMYMMATFIYLLFGLALTSMCINVVQEKLSATFEMAKLRIGTTIGLDANILMEEDILSEKSDTPDSRRRGSSVKSRRGSKSAQSSPPKSEERDLDKIDTVVTHTKENGVKVETVN
ncbi:potassium channel subfamily K member 1-like [Argiope bruennichi]|nr:potassium channel subfamily K member 1-like [Argiope bruennichi]XP_055926805.1 potassium channel subfamily K member 1-like [Argiope bruennichi]XP_055926806.1 potassium channel subfamily K member 1-like [Argiope bruennichi]